MGWSVIPGAENTENDGSFGWDVQGPAQNNCKIKITSIAHTNIYGESGLFDIVSTITTSITTSTSSTTTSISIPSTPTNLRVNGNYTGYALEWAWDAVPGADWNAYIFYEGSGCNNYLNSDDHFSGTHHTETAPHWGHLIQ